MSSNNIKLKYDSGNILSKDVHSIGIIALGSHRENHGAALPIDTDSKIAANVALNVATKTGATFLGIFYGATEYDYIKHGHHVKKDDRVKKQLNIKSVIIVNGHGGNNLIIEDIDKISKKTELKIIFNNSIIESEGPHACTGELSMGAVLGITDMTSLKEHENFIKHPEVGMVGLKEARDNEPIINKEALTIEKEGFEVNMILGQDMLENAQKEIINEVKKLL